MLRADIQDNLLVLTLNDAKRRNPISRAMGTLILAELDKVASDSAIRAVVLTGAGGNFCSGGDFNDMQERSLDGWRDHFDHMVRLVRRMIAYPKPIVAAVEGWAAGAGLSLACCCDMIVAAEDARFAYAFDRMAVLPDFGLAYTLPVRVGAVRARQIMIWGETFDATAAKSERLIDRIAPSGGALAEALSVAARATDGAPLPVALLKPFLTESLDRALAFEIDNAPVLFRSADHAEGLAAFKAKRRPVFLGT